MTRSLAAPGYALALGALVLSRSSCAAVSRYTSQLSSTFGGREAPPREKLIDGVRETRDEHVEVQQHFTEAFDVFQRLTAPQAVELEDLVEELEVAVAACNRDAERLRQDVVGHRAQAEALTTEWNAQLGQFSGEEMREKSAAMLSDTTKRSDRLVASLERVQERMDPVLAKYRDYLLFFGHNLTARAIATLDDTYGDFETEVEALQKEMERSRSEMNSFLQAIEGAETP